MVVVIYAIYISKYINIYILNIYYLLYLQAKTFTDERKKKHTMLQFGKDRRTAV